MFRTALISLDYSAAQGPLLECLADLRDIGVARVVLTHVVRQGYGQGASYGNRDALEDWLRERAAPLRAAGLEVGIDIRAAGEVAMDILQAAGEHGADLIVIGSRGQNMIRGLFLGSVAREVIRLSALPVRLEWIEATGEDGDAACARTCHAGLRRLLLPTISRCRRRPPKRRPSDSLRTQASSIWSMSSALTRRPATRAGR